MTTPRSAADPIVLYNSHYGATEEYAREFAQRYGTSPRPLGEADQALAENSAAALVVFSPNYAGTIEGAQYLKGAELGARRAALAVVGMTLVEQARAEDRAAGALGDKAEQVKRFYLPGRLDHSRLGRSHKAVLWAMNKMLKAKKDRSANEEAMLAGYGKDVSRIDFAELEPIAQWLEEGR